MNIHTASKTSRRDFLKLSAGALLAAGVAPGCARFADGGRGESGFSFVVMNDAHFYTPKCPEFFVRVKASVLALPEKPELCLFVGDLSENGSKKEVGGMKEVLDSLRMRWYGVPGNHDYITQTDRSGYDALLPGSLNYSFEHRGWRIIALDTTEGKKATRTIIQPHTMAWMKENAPRLNPKQPTLIFTHFPLGPTAPHRPLNTDELLAPFTEFNLVQVFNGHWHAFTEGKVRETVFVTNKCCSISKGNHDKTKEKGYFLCTAKDGKIERRFVEVAVA